MPALTETEARARAALIEVISYDLFADLNPKAAEPVRSRTKIRFTCAEPGADTFADLAATATSVVLNGHEVPGRPDGGRLALRGLAAENTLVVEAEVADDDLFTRFTRCRAASRCPPRSPPRPRRTTGRTRCSTSRAPL